MKKFLIFITIIIFAVAAFMFFKKDFIKKDDVLTKDCSNCNYSINDTKVTIKENIVKIGDKEYKDIERITLKNDVILLIKKNGIIGYKDGEIFNYGDGFDSSYSGMRIETIKIDNNKIIIQTTRLLDKWTLDLGDKFPICTNGTLNYNGLSANGIDVNEPVTITYEITYNNEYSKPIITYKKSLAAYYKELGNCLKD